ncbi:hypothetical protein BH20ACT19_BH20ACT19_11390 [soil metagenome]
MAPRAATGGALPHRPRAQIVLALSGAWSILPPYLGQLLAGTCFLAGLWQAATHVPLVLDGGGSETPWASVLLHSSPGLPILAIALWLALRTSAAEL